MRRQGWALCLGLFVGGTVAAQPPATGGRNPPAPQMPGEVIAQTPGSRPVTTAAWPTKSSAVKPAQAVAETPRPPGPPAVSGTPITATVGPAAPGSVAGPAAGEPVPPRPGSAGPDVANWSGGHGGCLEWLTFRSRARQSGHYVTPYIPPLLAWFPCEPGYGRCGLPGAPACAGGPGGTPPGQPAPGCPAADAPPPFIKTGDGLSFSPGGAPMANPTTQVSSKTHWRPK
jgi:hypothetical protein